MPRPFDVPQCTPSAETKARVWAWAKTLNRRARKRGWRRPFTGATMELLNELLHARRPAGGLWLSEAELAERIGRDVRTVQRGKAALIQYRLIIRHKRTRSVAWPVRMGGKLYQVRKGMRTSDAFTFPDMRQAFPCGLRTVRRARLFAVGGITFGEGEKRITQDATTGQFLPAAVRARLEKERATEQELRQQAARPPSVVGRWESPLVRSKAPGAQHGAAMDALQARMRARQAAMGGSE